MVLGKIMDFTVRMLGLKEFFSIKNKDNHESTTVATLPLSLLLCIQWGILLEQIVHCV